MKVIKRDGSEQEFDATKIKKAIQGAWEDILPQGERIKDEVLEDLTQKVLGKLDKRKNYNVEEIQDLVEFTLMEEKYYAVAKQYISYRQTHKMVRNKYKELMDLVSDKMQAKKVENQNANLDENTFSGKEKEAISAILREHALSNLVLEKTRYNHLNNIIYIHDLDSYSNGMHNCFERKTRFITSKGIMSFENFEDGESVEVLNKDGLWSRATIHKYGRGKINDIVLTRSGKEVVLGATSNHRWILKNGEVTTNLSVGDELFALTSLKDSFEIVDDEDAYWWCFGFVIGDGCDHYKRTQCRLCGQKIKYAPIFEKAHYKLNGRDVYAKSLIVNKQSFLDNKMWKMLSLKQKQMLFNGYLCADGQKEGIECATSDERVKDMLVDISCVSGKHIHSIRLLTRDTSYKKDALIWVVRFTKSHSVNSVWRVKSITPRSHCNDTLWCVEEPSTHSFTLEGGIVTGNCLTIPFDDLLAKGFTVRQTDIRPAGSVNTAMQLVAVICQLQSLCQFGGVSASHLDWTMVPYVRKSFAKHYKDGLKYVEENAKIDKEIETMLKNAKDYSIEDNKYKEYSDKSYKYALDMTEKETHQAVEALFHNLNSLQSRSGCQLPFTSINYGTCTLPEGRMVIKELLTVSIEGLGKFHRTSIFPCGIFQYMKGVNDKPGTPNYDLKLLALESTSKRLYPNYANVDWSGNIGYDRNDPKTYFSTMG